MSKNELKDYILSHLQSMKRNIEVNTIRGFLLSIFATMLLGLAVSNLQEQSEIPMILQIPNDTIIVHFPVEPEELETEKIPEVIEETESLPQSNQIPQDDAIVVDGTEKVAGDYKAVEDGKIKDEVEIATIKEAGISLSKPGLMKDLKKLFKTTDKPISSIEKPKNISDDIVEVPIFQVEEPPQVDLIELQRNIIYPGMAIKASIEGKVVVEVLVSKTGKPLKCEIVYSDSEMLDEAAINAVMKTNFVPAIQNGINVNCRVTIPISFRLR
jgi:TonB family protein